MCFVYREFYHVNHIKGIYFCAQGAKAVICTHVSLFSVFVSIQRRHFEQVKAGIPVILNVLKVISSESDDGDADSEDLFNRAICIANSIQAVCEKLVGDTHKYCPLMLLLYLPEIFNSLYF